MEKEDLLHILEDLTDEEFENFKWYLKNGKVGNTSSIKKSKLSKAERQKVVDLMVQKYTFAGAVEVTKNVLKKISRNDLVEKLPTITSGAEDQERVLQKRFPVVEKQSKLVEDEFSREMCARHPKMQIFRGVNVVILEGPDEEVQLAETKLEDPIKKLEEKRVKLSAALITFMKSSGVISKYQTRFQRSLRSPVALEVGSDLVLSSLSSAALDEAETAVLRDLSEVTVRLQGSTASSPHLDKVKEILVKAKDEANLQELRVEVSFVPDPRAAVIKVQLVGYTEHVNKLKDLLLEYQIEHLQNLHLQQADEVQKNISDKNRQAGGAGGKLLDHRTTQDSYMKSGTTDSLLVLPDGPDLRILIIGKTGVGKSASGNTILGEKRFRSRPSSESVTQTCEKGVTCWGNRVVSVVDTPGILDTWKSAEFIKDEIVTCIKVSCPGPHVFLLVITVGRFTREDKHTVEALQELFGPEANQFMIVLFTHGDDLGYTTIQEYVREGPPDLQRVIQSCGNRFHVFENSKRDRNQVVELIKMIDDMVARNRGECYTDAMYQQVQDNAKIQNMRVEDLDDLALPISDSLLRRALIFFTILAKE